MLAWVGCVADTPEVATWFGDDIAFRADSYESTSPDCRCWASCSATSARAVPHCTGSASPPTSWSPAARPIERGLLSHCLTTAQHGGPSRARRRTYATRCSRSSHAGTARAFPATSAARTSRCPMRLFHLADTVEVFHRGRRSRRCRRGRSSAAGKHFDPAAVDLFCRVPATCSATRRRRPTATRSSTPSRRCSDASPRPSSTRALEAVADFTDLRSPSRAGPLPGVAELAAPRGATVRTATEPMSPPFAAPALLHDVGLHGVPATILDKPGPLSATESERMRMHAYYTDRMLSRPPALARDRSDRRAGPRALRRLRIPPRPHRRGDPGRPAGSSPPPCAYHAMTEPRPYRPAMTAAQAAAELLARRVRAGRLDADAVDAVLGAAGPAPRQTAQRPGRPHAPRGRGADAHRPGRLHPAGRAATRHHPQDRRAPTSSGSTPRPAPQPARRPRCSPCSTACSTASNRSICRANPGRRVAAALRTVPFERPPRHEEEPAMAGKAVISLATGLEDPEKVTVAFLVAVGAAESGRQTLMFLTKEAVRLAARRHRHRRRLRRLPAARRPDQALRGSRRPLLRVPGLLQRQEARRRHLIAGAEVQGTVPCGTGSATSRHDVQLLTGTPSRHLSFRRQRSRQPLEV